MKLIGLTGLIASGKSTASHHLRQKGYHIIDADQISHRVTDRGKVGYVAVLEEFQDALDKSGQIDRKKLSDIVFSDKKKLQLLNDTLHPIILDEVYAEIEKNSNEDFVFLDAPLLFETGLDKRCDLVLLIVSSRPVQMDRLIARDGITAFKANSIIESQMDVQEKKKKSDVIITNDGTKEELIQKLDKFISELKDSEDNKQFD